MSHHEALNPDCAARNDALKFIVTPGTKDLGGFAVRRVLPSEELPKVGPFVFVDEMGPATFPPGEGINVRPHPHIGLCTVTFLFEGEILHRDSLDYVQAIQPGAVNLMTAGKGIVHSERTSEALLASGQSLHGMQVWMALPDDQQEIEPAFEHHPGDTLPIVNEEGVRTTVIIGQYRGIESPVRVLARTIYLEQNITAGTSVSHEAEEELAVYVVEGSVTIAGCDIERGQMAVFDTTTPPELVATEDARIMILGGEAMSPRHHFWNFVHSSKERIEQAKQDWRDGNFDMVKGDDEFIPLP